MALAAKSGDLVALAPGARPGAKKLLLLLLRGWSWQSAAAGERSKGS